MLLLLLLLLDFLLTFDVVIVVKLYRSSQA